jgi:hypothetical protein
MSKVDKIERLKRLREYAPESKYQMIDVCIKHNGNTTKAARELGYRDESPIRQYLKRLELNVAKTMAPVVALSPSETPAGFSIDRISKHIDKEGNVSGWVIANRDKQDQFEAFKEAWGEFCTTIERVKLTPVPEMTLSKILCDYTIGDAHLGLYAWAAEAGDDWTLADGSAILKAGINQLVNSAPPSKYAYLLDVGDYLHSDNMDNETRASGNKLDVDTRWAKVLKVAVMCMCDMIDALLQKHEVVYYRSAMGNHNEHTSVMMMIAMQMRYADEPRVVVLDSPAIHHYFQFGCNLLADTHGHTTKADTLPILMATDVPHMWASTTNRIFRTGHVHHLSQKEYHGCSVITYRTLTPKDAWHAGQGYRSNREMQCTIYHENTGKVGANFVNPSMLGYS